MRPLKFKGLFNLNRQALAIAKEVAADHAALFAGNLSNTNAYDPVDAASRQAVRAMFDEQLGWAVDAGVDYVVAETFWHGEEALLAAEAIAASGLPSVVTLAIRRRGTTRESWPATEACQRLADAGASVVGPNCIRGPATMLPLLGGLARWPKRWPHPAGEPLLAGHVPPRLPRHRRGRPQPQPGQPAVTSRPPEGSRDRTG